MAEVDAVVDEIIWATAKLVEMDLVEYAGGNVSVRVDDEILISKRSSSKAIPTRADFVRTAVEGGDEGALIASSALEIHREIYRQTDAKAIVHAHPRLVNSLSFFVEAIEPVDENGLLYLGRSIPVVAAPSLFGWNLVARELGEALVDNPVAVLKWHGTFAKGADLSRALHLTRAIEVACDHIIRVNQLSAVFGKPTMPPQEVAEFLGGIETRGLGRVNLL